MILADFITDSISQRQRYASVPKSFGCAKPSNAICLLYDLQLKPTTTHKIMEIRPAYNAILCFLLTQANQHFHKTLNPLPDVCKNS